MNTRCEKWAFALFAALLCASAVHAQSTTLIMKKVEPGRVRIDGAVPEWRTIAFVRVSEGEESGLRFALGYDDGGMYLAAIVGDDQLVRSRRPGTDEDAIVVTFAMPEQTGEGWIGSEVWLFAGVSGKQAASASVGSLGQTPKSIKEIKIVEGPRSNAEPGYVLEAYIPWAIVPGGERWTDARAMVRLHDVDRTARAGRRAAGRLHDKAELALLPALRREGFVEIDPLKCFLKDFDLAGMKPKFDLRGDVSGDGRAERVVQIGTYLVVTGPGHRHGTGYTYLQFPVTSEADVRGARLADLTGDGKAELLVELLQHVGANTRTVWQALSLDGNAPKALFGAFLRHGQPEGFVQGQVTVKAGVAGQLAQVVLGADRAYGIGQDNFRPNALAGVEPLLVPWGQVKERTYRWDGQGFAIVSEQPFANTPLSSAAAGSNAKALPKSAGEPIGPTKPASAEPQALIAAFRHAAAVAPEVAPRFTQKANLAEDQTAETLMVLDRNLLVYGPKFRAGTGYFYYQIPVAEAQDILKVTAADLTGDGRAEVLFRVRQPVGDVTRELLLVYQLNNDSFLRLLAVEVRRAQGNCSVDNEVHLQRTERGFVLEVRPGRAVGWSAIQYPFLQDASESLLLPWKDTAVRYRFDGRGLVKSSLNR
jgi:hypothetical protein